VISLNQAKIESCIERQCTWQGELGHFIMIVCTYFRFRHTNGMTDRKQESGH